MKSAYNKFLIITCCLLLVATTVMARNGRSQAADSALAPRGNGNQMVLPDDLKATGDFVSGHFLGSSYCVRCHDKLNGENVTVDLVEEWRVSIMANSFVDPLWRAKVRSETLRLPQYEAAIEEKCVRCHAPMASIEATFDDADISLFEGGFADRQNPYHALAMEGISCTLCHQITADNLGMDESFSGGFEIADNTNLDRPLYAQIPDPFARSMQRAVKYTPAYGKHMQGSELCATCHELMTPYVDMTTNLWASDKFAEQTPYSEWLASIYSKPASDAAKSCQDCHLTHEEFVPAARAPNWLDPLTDFSRHTNYTVNLTMQDILQNFDQELGIDGSGLDEAAAQGAEYLAGAGTLERISSTFSDNELEVTLKVHNHTGHKLPTGIPFRRVYLHFLVTDAAGVAVFESGRMLPDGSIDGVDADTDLTLFEPHHKVIDSPDKVQVYEPIMGNTEGQLTYTLLLASQYLKDNRLLPDGFDKDNAADTVQVYGDAKRDSDFLAGSDTITYQVNKLTGDEYHVLVELRDQSMAFPFLKDLFEDNDDDKVADFERMYLDPAIEKDSGMIDSLQLNFFTP